MAASGLASLALLALYAWLAYTRATPQLYIQGSKTMIGVFVLISCSRNNRRRCSAHRSALHSRLLPLILSVSMAEAGTKIVYLGFTYGY